MNSMHESKFEQEGVERQINSHSMKTAKANFERSCDLCCRFGRNCECENCAIKSAYEQNIEKHDVEIRRHDFMKFHLAYESPEFKAKKGVTV